MADQESHSRKYKLQSAQTMRQFENAKQWEEVDDLEGENQQFSQTSKQSVEKKQRKNKIDGKFRKATQVEQYEKALIQLRSQGVKFYRPFDKQRLNISIMKAIIMLKDAIEKDKDFVQVLRQMGCKTRMRVRNKTAARELFEVMLRYLEESVLPPWMHERHKELLQKDDSKFDDDYMKMEDNDT